MQRERERETDLVETKETKYTKVQNTRHGIES